MSEDSCVCTLFEGDYHYGLVALFNSLYKAGFRGTLWAGYRGTLPPWAKPVRDINGYSMFSPTPECTICFVPVATKWHLANYKPAFLRHVLETLDYSKTLFYIDTDVVVRFPWTFFSAWALDSLALCEDVNSPMSENHPKRQAWRRMFEPRGIGLLNPSAVYVNSGFLGVPRALGRFLALWESILVVIEQSGVDLSFMGAPHDYRFWTIDQDALNIATMATDCPLSVAGKDGMGFVLTNGPMLHAVGSPKPWKCSTVREFLDGRPPTQAQREYWNHVESPIRLFDASAIHSRQLSLSVASFFGRLYRR